MHHKFKIAAVQLNLNTNIPELVESIRTFIVRAKKQGVNIVCFPEDSLYAGPKKNKIIISKIREFCKDYQIWCIITAHIKEKTRTYNSAVLIDHDGKIFGKHKKVLICDSPNVSAGSNFEVYETPFATIGVAICWDVSHPEAIFEMAKKGAQVIFCPMFWCYEEWAHRKFHREREKKILQSLILTRAFENLVYVVFCNAFDPKEKSLISYSAIAEPHRMIKEIFDRQGMIVGTVNLDYLNKMRKKYERYYDKHL